MYTYAITIKYNKKDKIAYKEDIDEVCKDLVESHGGYWLPSEGYEIDTKKRLHYHGTFRTEKEPRFKTFNKRHNGWIIMFKKVWSKDWDSYCIKQALNFYEQEQILDTHYYMHNHMFKD